MCVSLFGQRRLDRIERKFKMKSKWAFRLFFLKFKSIVCSFLSLVVACEDASDCSGHETCRGSGSSWNCCTIQSKCGLHEGDCDSDDECEGTLTCGIGNCAVHLFPENADCCQEPGNQSNIFSMFLEKLLKSMGYFKK